MRVRQPQGQPFSFCRRRTSTRKPQEAGSAAAAGVAILSQAVLHESEQLLEQASTAPGAAAALAAAFGFHGTVGMAVVVAGAAAVLAGLAAGEEAHGARAMMEKIFIGLSFPKSEERNMGSRRASGSEFYANLGQRGAEPALFAARVALCLLNPKRGLGRTSKPSFGLGQGPPRAAWGVFDEGCGWACPVRGKAGASKTASRRTSYRRRSWGPKKQPMLAKIDSIDTIECDGEWEALLMESRLIKDTRPPFNTRLVDDKTFRIWW